MLRIPAITLAVSALLTIAGCTTTKGREALEPLTTDGCSLFPDGVILSCCTDHDIDYWQGGSAERRKDADSRFRQCVEETSGSATFAALAYRGVRIGGNPYLPPAAGWGYGWPFGRGYAELEPEEFEWVLASMVEVLVVSRQACADGDERACHLRDILNRRGELALSQ